MEVYGVVFRRWRVVVKGGDCKFNVVEERKKGCRNSVQQMVFWFYWYLNGREDGYVVSE